MLSKLLNQVVVDKVKLLTVYIEFCRTLSSVNLQIAHWFRLPVDQMILDQSTFSSFGKQIQISKLAIFYEKNFDYNCKLKLFVAELVQGCFGCFQVTQWHCS